MEKEYYLQAIIDNAVDGIIVIDTKGIITYMNTAGLEMFGFTSEELIGENVSVLIDTKHAKHHDSFIVNYLKTGISQVVGNRRKISAQRKDGSAFQMWLSVSKSDDEEQGFTGIFQDMTPYEKKDALLSESQMRLNAIIETAVDGIITIDENGIIEGLNPAAANLFGYHPSEVIGNNVKMLMPNPHRTQHDNYLNNYKRTGIRKIIGIGREVRGKRKDGTGFPFKLSISEVKLANRRLFTGIIHDISDRERAKEVELALEKVNELNELKSRFVSIASHEFRTPLSSIATSATLINRYEQDPDVQKRRKHTSRILNSVKTLTEILNDFLSLSKLEEGKVETKPIYFDLNVLCEEIIEEMQETTENVKIHLQYEGEAKVYLDKNIIRNILHNLISNAIKYSTTGKPVNVVASTTDERILIEVKDEGIGIPKEEQKEMFGRFFRAKNVSNIQGTGLGLSIVARYVELLNGSIGFVSEENKGTTFSLKIPNSLVK